MAQARPHPPRSGILHAVADARVVEQDIERLRTRYEFRQCDDIADYLRAYPHLIARLIKTAEAVPTHFGENARLALEIFTDPEADDDHELFGLIRTGLAPEEADARLDHFAEDWWYLYTPPDLPAITFDVERD